MSIRLSPSQINLFLTEPSVWVLNKFYGIYGDMGAAAKRGQAVEHGLNSFLMNGLEIATAKKAALHVFDEEMENIYDDKTEEERSIIEPMIDQAVELFSELEAPEKIQVRHEVMFGEAPMLGIVDFDMGEYCIDLKSTKRCPSSAENISAEHIRQMAYYFHATGKPQKLAYVTPKKYALYEVSQEQINQALKEMHAAVKAMWSCYEISEQRGNDALTILYPPRDTNSFYWDTKTLNKAQEIWF